MVHGQKTPLFGGLVAVVCASTFLFSHPALALEKGGVLPKGVNRVRNLHFFTFNTNSRFDNNGYVDNLFPEITLMGQDLAAKADRKYPIVKYALDSFGQIRPGLEKSIFKVDFTGNTTISSSHISYFAYQRGITKRFSIGAAIPFQRITVDPNLKAKLTLDPDSLALQEAGGAGNQLLREFQANAHTLEQDVTDDVFTELGYKKPRKTTVQGLGEAIIGGRYLFYKGNKDSFAVQLNAVLPTSTHKKDYTNFFDPGIGDGQVDIFTQFVYDRKLFKKWVFTGSVKYFYQLPDTIYRPVPPKDDELGVANLSLGDEHWDDVHRKLGDYIDSEFSMERMAFNDYIGFFLAYHLFIKSKDHYSGSKDLDYNKLAQNTNQVAHRYDVGLSFSTVNKFLENKFPLPLQWHLFYVDTFAGKNTFDLTYIGSELDLFF